MVSELEPFAEDYNWSIGDFGYHVDPQTTFCIALTAADRANRHLQCSRVGLELELGESTTQCAHTDKSLRAIREWGGGVVTKYGRLGTYALATFASSAACAIWLIRQGCATPLTTPGRPTSESTSA